MAIKKYAFLAIALLTSAVKADEDSCYKFYVGGDLGMGIFSINRYNDGNYNEFIDADYNDESYSSSSKSVFIGGGRIGLAWNGSECWYAAIEGNVHSARGTSCSSSVSCFDYDNGTDASTNDRVRITIADKTNLIAGIHGHLGYKVNEDTVFYGIIGGKYLKGNYYQSFNFDENAVAHYLNINGYNTCYSTWGWTAGFGMVANLWCNWDLRLEALYAKFNNKCFNNNIDISLASDDSIALVNNLKTTPRLFYGVVSLAYNF